MEDICAYQTWHCGAPECSSAELEPETDAMHRCPSCGRGYDSTSGELVDNGEEG